MSKENQKVTIYVLGSMFGVNAHEGKLVEHGRRDYAQYSNAPFVVFRPFRKRRDVIIQGVDKNLLIVKGWNQPKPCAGRVPVSDGPGVSVTRSRYSSCDPRWASDFDAMINKAIASELVEVIADYRPGTEGASEAEIDHAKRVEAYDQKQAAKREAKQATIDKALAEAKERFGTARKIGSHIPMGQPILVGHHSERRHRRDLAKIDANMDKAIKASKKADRLSAQLASGPNTAISSDDPSAIGKLREKLAGMEADRERMKASNKVFIKAVRVYRKENDGNDPADLCAWSILIQDLDLPIEEISAYKQNARFQPFYNGIKYGYHLTNLGGNIKRVKERIKELEQERDSVAEPTYHETDGFKLVYNSECNRVQFLFDGKPSADIRAILKSNAFRWAPSKGAWQRQLTANGRGAATLVQRQIAALGASV